MNYWLLSSEYPPFFGGGIGTYCATTAKMLADHGHKVSVFVCDATVTDISISHESHIRVVRFNTSRTRSSGFLGHTTNISYEFADIVKYFIEKEGRPDCIEAQEYLGIAYYLLQFKLLLYDWCKDVPVLITMHSPSFLYMEYNHIPQYRYPNFWICEMERFCLQAADYVISPSGYMLQELGKRFALTNKNIAVIPNPFDGTSNNISALPVTQEENEIVFYGKLTAQKGAFRLLGYFQQLWDKGFNKPLYLLGGQDIVYHPEGVMMGDLIRIRYKKYIETGLLRMEDRIKPAEIASRLSRAEVVIVPSDNDNLPYVVFEMMALGKIVLVSKQGGHSEVVENDEDGFIFDHYKPESFFSQLKLILELSYEQRTKISARAVKKIAENYNPDIIYRQKINVISRIAGRDNSRKIFPFIRELQGKSANETSSYKPGKLSIVVPYFNMGIYLDETIQSLLKADYPDKEIVIVNDGSTDLYSLKKLDAYRTETIINVLDVPNGGLGKARNLGAIHASGEFLAFLDADDTVARKYYSQCIAIFRQYENVHFAGCWVQYFGNSRKIWPTFLPEPPLILYHNLINTSSLVYKRNSFLAAGKNDIGMIFPGLEDYDSAISMLENGFGGVVIPEPLFNYRVRGNSMIRSVSRAKKLYLYQHISEKHKQFYATFATEVFNLLNANGPAIGLDNPTLDLHLADRLPFGGKMSGKIIALVKKNRLVKTLAYKIYKLLKK